MSNQNSQSNILRHFTPGRNPRPGQIQVLQTIEKEWDSADVFVIEASTGFGKSDLALTIAKWASSQKKLRTVIGCPNNVLVEQYRSSSPKTACFKGATHYSCPTASEENKRETNCANGGVIATVGKRGGVKRKKCADCPYMKDMRKLFATPYGVTNFHMYLARKDYRDVFIADEAHSLIGMVRDLAARTLWKHEVHYPDGLKDYRALMKWLESPNAQLKAELRALQQDLLGSSPKYLVEKGWELYRGKNKECLKLLPIDTADQPPLLWPRAVKKIILMSATINAKDLEQIGLSKRRVCWITPPSAIPPDRRPIEVCDPGYNLSFDATEDELNAAAAGIRRIADAHPGERGVIHLTYGLLERLGPRIGTLGGRVLTHGKENKFAVYTQFLTGTKDQILVCAGLFEGIDLPQDLGRWQIIAKVPWPALTDSAWKWLAETDPVRYQWEALRTVMQGAGRVCRGPTDYGKTVILDRSFGSIDEELMPTWFRSALVSGDRT